MKNAKDKGLNVKDLGIRIVRDVKTLVEQIYNQGSSYQFRFESNSAIHSVEFENELFKLPKPIKIKKTRRPDSKLVEIYHKHDGRKGCIVVQVNTNKDLFFILQNYQTGYQGYKSNNKLDRYRSLYLAYEGLEKNKKYKYTAIRHAISHVKLDNVKALNVIQKLFESEKIDINNRNHKKVLLNLHKELLQQVEKSLISKLIKLARKSKNRIGDYVIV